MEKIGEYKQLTAFTNENAGTAEWCIAEKSKKKYFVKKFQSPVYPSKDLGLPEKKYNNRVERFHASIAARTHMYNRLRESDKFCLFVLPVDVISYQYHICTIADYVVGNLKPEQICRLSEWQRLVLMRTLTLALVSVHQAGVVHCDMKPDNVIIHQDDQNGNCALKLIDFDGSFFESDPPEDVSGDPTYFSPEAYAMNSTPGIHLDRRIDIFALGSILHYFWTGKLPRTDSDLTIGQAALKGDPIRLEPSIPDRLKTVIYRALQGNPDKRITADEIYQELGEMLSNYPVKIINLQKGKAPEPGIKGSAVREPSPRPRGSGPVSEPIKPIFPTSVSIPVLCCDSKGNNLRAKNIEVKYGEEVRVHALDIADYHVVSSDRVTVYVNKSGKPNINTVRFTYEADKKDHSAGWAVFWLIAVVLFFIAVGNIK